MRHMSKLDEIKKAYEEQRAKPHSSKSARQAGVIFLIFGLVFAGINYYLWTSQDGTYIILLAAALGFFGLGLYMAITGKTPKPRR